VKTRSTFIVLLLFIWTAVPALTCLIAGEVLTAEEQACCKAMGGECGDSTAADHSCCNRTTSTAQPAVASSQADLTIICTIAARVPPLAQPPLGQEFAPDWLLDPSPPPRITHASPILRI